MDPMGDGNRRMVQGSELQPRGRAWMLLARTYIFPWFQACGMGISLPQESHGIVQTI